MTPSSSTLVRNLHKQIDGKAFVSFKCRVKIQDLHKGSSFLGQMDNLFEDAQLNEILKVVKNATKKIINVIRKVFISHSIFFRQVQIHSFE